MMTDCLICFEEAEEEQGICLKCQVELCKVFGAKIEFLDKEPYFKCTPKEKENVFDLISALSRLNVTIDRIWNRLENHQHLVVQKAIVKFDKER